MFIPLQVTELKLWSRFQQHQGYHSVLPATQPWWGCSTNCSGGGLSTYYLLVCCFCLFYCPQLIHNSLVLPGTSNSHEYNDILYHAGKSTKSSDDHIGPSCGHGELWSTWLRTTQIHCLIVLEVRGLSCRFQSWWSCRFQLGSFRGYEGNLPLCRL